ncbi:hypothetical protein [Candidatus Kryptonium thompsonii]|uniref:hypothetical protein n=1 Tax=Candidatus Kryptonium thompsonii TaxID=1633631 RepID=UPI00070807AE|nr:hypothetical protein [Candidatus Kryptonium thompsoni]CUT06224.1 hypothetical protein JGI11_01555 [Candidatus Kryptonium thompsoni]
MRVLKFVSLFFFFFHFASGQIVFNLIDHGSAKEIEIKIDKPEIKEVEIDGRKYSIVFLKKL